MESHQSEKKPRKKYPSDYKPKKQEKPLAILHINRVVQKEARQHVYLYRAGATVGSAYSQDMESRLHRFADELASLKPGWYLTGNTVEFPEFGAIKVFSVVSPNQDHAMVKFQQYVGGFEVEKVPRGGIQKLPIEILCHVLRPVGKHTFFEIFVEDREQEDGRKKTGAGSSPCSSKHAAALRDPELRRFIHSVALWNARNWGLPPADLEQDAWVRALESKTNNIELLKTEAKRAIWVSVKRAVELRKKTNDIFISYEQIRCGRLGKPEKMPVLDLLISRRKKT